MSTLTPNFSFILPSVADPTDQDLWGGYLNSNWSSNDTLLKTARDSVFNSQTGNYTILTSDRNSIIAVDATGGNYTITLPTVSSAGDGFKVSVLKTDASTNTVIVDGNGAETINNVTSITLGARFQIINLVCDGTVWYAYDVNDPPSQTGNAGKLLSTDGVSTEWQTVSLNRGYAESSTPVTVVGAIPTDNTIPQNTEGTEIITVTITPRSSSSRVRVRFNADYRETTGAAIVIALFKDGDVNAIAARIVVGESNGGVAYPATLEFEHSPATASAVTYKIRMGKSGGTCVVGEAYFGAISRITLVAEDLEIIA